MRNTASLTATVVEFSRNLSAVLDNPSFETKQKILRLVVERVEFVEDQITIRHVIQISDVLLQRDQRVEESIRLRVKIESRPGREFPLGSSYFRIG